ncbi:MAG TPA: haloacid dehalogenase-like hydrolase [Polyangiaceae bacterium]|nr:haloacid dehalogenase-like hydrolase [Polyangiaceae bacterium]
MPARPFDRPERPTVYLFDIDGTLITGGGGRDAMERALALAVGAAEAHASFSFSGMTDRAIARRALAELGAEPDEDTIGRVIEHYLAFLIEDLAAAPCATPAGALAALERAGSFEGVALGLGTGNVERGARAKLARVGLAGRFTFGGFGCDHEERAELLRVGAARGAARLGRAPEACRVVVVGDTPLDVAAAHAIGAECVAVATGSYARAELAACGPAFTCDRLDELFGD